jgi:hypothetical protein
MRLRTNKAGLSLPRHRATTANLSTLYPFHTGPGPTQRGPYLGENISNDGSHWFYDPFELYGKGLTDSNVLIAGRPGMGKSTAVKTFLYRELAYYGSRRFVAINDPKGEYGPLAQALGLTVIKLYPGGRHRLNLLDAAPGADAGDLMGRQTLMVNMLSVVLGRPLEGVEEALTARSIEHLACSRLSFDLRDLAQVVETLPTEVTGRADLVLLSDEERRTAANSVRFALGKLLDRSLRGMFDGPTTVDVDWGGGPGVVLDLSAVFEDSAALPLVMMAAASWLQSAMAGHTSESRRGLLVDDEVWAVMANEWSVRQLQARLKLCRSRGICNILICHKLSDLRSQSNDGTAAAKVAKGLLADTQTRIVFQQSADQVPEAQELLGLDPAVAVLLPRLVKGRSLWQVGDHNAVVEHVVSAEEFAFTDTDAAMVA